MNERERAQEMCREVWMPGGGAWIVHDKGVEEGNHTVEKKSIILAIPRLSTGLVRTCSKS